ncbi:MAG: DUF4350 domain-containing protein [Saprospiraceae bacterium]|nr:DUF4350 domain-containing protein [Saprospiraceae bacterium]MBP9193419.1 DUF4350 domain-containing protein [Saprospiraceae bacterium]
MRWDKLSVYLIYLALGFTVWFFYPVSENWLPSFHPEDKIPYGTQILKHAMSERGKLTIVNIDIDSLIAKADSFDANLLFINDRFEPNIDEMSSLVQFVEKGGVILLSTTSISYSVSDFLQIQWDYQTSRLDSSARTCFVSLKNSSNSQLCFPCVSPELPNSFMVEKTNEEGEPDSIIYPRDTLMVFNETGNTTALRILMGKGEWIVHSQPYAFSNFGLLNGHKDHANILLAMIQDKPVIWDVHFIKRSFSEQPNLNYSGSVLAEEQKSPIVEILKHDLLRWAYWLLFSGILLYFILLIKRKMRAIPVWRAPGNESVNFIRLIASVYLSGNDNKAILDKKLRMFLIHVHQSYGIRDFDWSNEARQLLCSVSGYDAMKLEKLAHIALNYEKGRQVSFGYLSAANQLVNEFVYNSKLK